MASRTIPFAVAANAGVNGCCEIRAGRAGPWFGWLASARYDEVVVDTAPIGHTLRIKALMKLEAKIREMAEEFGLSPADLNIDLGPLGRLR